MAPLAPNEAAYISPARFKDCKVRQRAWSKLVQAVYCRPG